MGTTAILGVDAKAGAVGVKKMIFPGLREASSVRKGTTVISGSTQPRGFEAYVRYCQSEVQVAESQRRRKKAVLEW